LNAPGLIDAHCHLDDERLSPEIPQVLERARAAGVTRIVTIGTDEVSSQAASDLARSYPDVVHHTVGAHPNEADRLTEERILAIERLARGTKPVAIGEIGLDYHHDSSKPNQYRLFERMLALARSLGLPAVVHDRDAHDDVHRMLKDHAQGMKVMLHCYSAGAASVDRFLQLGCHFSFAGPLTFKNGQDHRNTLKLVPLERLVVETDAPWLAPDPHRGKRNEPAFVELVARKAAEVRGMAFEDLARITTANSCAFYGLPG
jgi:TatD DNase family protein